jgi:transcriptional regulator with XRE-family HTH domain
MGFWPRLLELIEQRGKTRKELVAAAGIAPNSFATWVRRGTIPNGYVLAIIAKELGVTVEYLVNGPAPEPPASTYLAQTQDDSSAWMMAERPRDHGLTVAVTDWIAANQGLVSDLMDLTAEQLRMVEDQVWATADRNRSSRKKSKPSAG